MRIPKILLDESGLEKGKEVELQVKKGEIRITPLKKEKKTTHFAVASEKAFAKDWLREEEEEAWAVYQSDK